MFSLVVLVPLGCASGLCVPDSSPYFAGSSTSRSRVLLLSGASAFLFFLKFADDEFLLVEVTPLAMSRPTSRVSSFFFLFGLLALGEIRNSFDLRRE